MGLATFTPAVKPGKYDTAVHELAAAVKDWDGTGNEPAWVETFTLVEGTVKGEKALVNPGKVSFQADANRLGYTARARAEKDNGDGTVDVTFTLTEMYKRLTKEEREAAKADAARKGGSVDTGADVVEASSTSATAAKPGRANR